MFVHISSLTIRDNIVSYWDLHMHIFSKAPQNDLMHGNKGRCWLLILLWSSSRRIVMADLWNTYKKNLLVSLLVHVYNKHPAYQYQHSTEIQVEDERWESKEKRFNLKYLINNFEACYYLRVIMRICFIKLCIIHITFFDNLQVQMKVYQFLNNGWKIDHTWP